MTYIQYIYYNVFYISKYYTNYILNFLNLCPQTDSNNSINNRDLLIYCRAITFSEDMIEIAMIVMDLR